MREDDTMLKAFEHFIVFFLLTTLSLSLHSCSERADLVGTWKTSATFLGVVTETSYEFRENSTGIRRSGILDLGTSFSYNISVSEQGIGQESGELEITTSILGVKSTEHYLYALEGDSLRLTTDKGVVTEYRKEAD